MSSKELEARLECMKRDMAAIEAEIKASKQGLKPYDWGERNRYIGINHEGVVMPRSKYSCVSLFNYDKSLEASRFAHKLKVLSCINNLKKTLGCDWEFTTNKTNFFADYEEDTERWVIDSYKTYNQGQIHFKNQEDVEKVCKYLNEHYPNGWALPDSTSECD